MTAVIGRADDCRIHVADPHISMQHARVRCTDGWWYLTDLESHNGTSLNRWKLAPNDPVRLHDGDVITLGPCCLTDLSVRAFILLPIEPDPSADPGD